MRANALLATLVALVGLDLIIRFTATAPSVANAQTRTIDKPNPISLTAATTDNGNQLLYRLWSNGDIDVRLVNPLRTQANDWPNSERAGLSFQEGWKLFQKGE